MHLNLYRATIKTFSKTLRHGMAIWWIYKDRIQRSRKSNFKKPHKLKEDLMRSYSYISWTPVLNDGKAVWKLQLNIKCTLPFRFILDMLVCSSCDSIHSLSNTYNPAQIMHNIQWEACRRNCALLVHGLTSLPPTYNSNVQVLPTFARMCSQWISNIMS